VHNGSKVPSNKIGVEGDVYIQTTGTKPIYLKKNGRWVE